jgi:hypothetical protein
MVNILGGMAALCLCVILLCIAIFAVTFTIDLLVDEWRRWIR